MKHVYNKAPSEFISLVCMTGSPYTLMVKAIKWSSFFNMIPLLFKELIKDFAQFNQNFHLSHTMVLR